MPAKHSESWATLPSAGSRSCLPTRGCRPGRRIGPRTPRRGGADLRLISLPERYDDLLAAELPLEPDERATLAAFAPLLDLCAELDGHGIGATVQHDDLHMNNVFVKDDALRVLDWGDASIAHPFFSLFETFRFLIEMNRLGPDDPWFARLRDAYLEPWGPGHVETFELAQRIAGLARRSPGSTSARHSRIGIGPGSTKGSPGCCGWGSARRSDPPTCDSVPTWNTERSAGRACRSARTAWAP